VSSILIGISQAETVVLRLVEICPVAVLHKDEESGRYPLHHACASNQSEKVVLTFMTRFPDAFQRKDDGDDSFP
jgi:hypothetical protein